MAPISKTIPLKPPETPSISFYRIFFCVAFFIIFLFRYMIYPYFDSIPNLLASDSWWYDFSRLYLEGKFLGVDFFFTYGPLAQRLSPLIEAGQKISWFGIFFQLSIIAIYLFVFFDLSALAEKAHPFKRFSFYFLILAFATLHPLLYRESEAVYDILIFSTYLMFFLGFQRDHSQNKNLYFLLFLTVTLLQFKFSIGLHALAVFFCVSLFLLFQKRSLKFLASLWLEGILGSFLLFYFLTGHWKFFTFWKMAWGITSTYSETMVYHPFTNTDNWLIYPMGVLSVICFLCLGVLLAEKYRLNKPSKIAFIVNLSITGFYLYKHGFVRADQHTFEFYLIILPLSFFLAGLYLIQTSPFHLDFYAIGLFLILSFQTWAFNTQMFGGLEIESQFKNQNSIQNYWLENPRAMPRFLTWKNDLGQITDAKLKYCLFQRYPHLYKSLDQMDDGKGKVKKTISFAPWENLKAAAVPQFNLSPSPSLQIYCAAAQPVLDGLDRRFLISLNRPDVIVLGPETLDSRNPFSEFNDWLGPLLRFYEPLEVDDGQTVFVQNRNHASFKIQCSADGPGLFFRLKAPSMGLFRDALFSLVKIFFKSPDIKVRVEMVDAKGIKRVIFSRGFYSQLRKGVYFGDGSIGQLLMECYRKTPDRPHLWVVTNAVAFRERGFYNLPVFPDVMPLKVEYCRLHKDLMKDD